MNTSAISLDHFEKVPSFPSILQHYREKVIDNRSKTHYTNETIIAGLKARDRVVINFIYKQSFRQIKFLVTTNSGSQMDAEDIFQDAMIVIYKKISADNLNLTSSFETFLYSICKHLWLQRLGKREFNLEFKDIAENVERQDDHNMEELVEDSERYNLFQQHFLKLSIKDQKVLKLYMSKTSLKEIALIMGYKSDKYAKHRKFLCKEKLKNSILNDRQFREIYQYEWSA